MAIALKYEKSSQSRSLVPSIFGYTFGVVVLLIIIRIPIDVYRESNQTKWPAVVATIKQQAVRKSYRRGGDEWHIETELRYTSDGEELTSSIRSRVGSFGEERDMYRWASQHQPGTPLPIRYDPEHHNIIVPEAGDMPETGSQVPGDLKMLLILSVLSVTLIAIGRALRRRQLKSL
jgi:hypothetical protein